MVGVPSTHASTIGFSRKCRRTRALDLKNICAVRGRMDLWHRLAGLTLSTGALVSMCQYMEQRNYRGVEAYLAAVEADLGHRPNAAETTFIRRARAYAQRSTLPGTRPSNRKRASELLDRIADEALADVLKDAE